jgi:hypothetical protein
MSLPLSGIISLGSIGSELGYALNTPISLNDTAVRNLLEITSGTVGLNHAYGKTNKPPVFSFNDILSSDSQNYNLQIRAQAAGWDLIVPIKAVVTINSGVYLYGTNGPAFDTGSAVLPVGSELLIVNNGFIIGTAGSGGDGGWKPNMYYPNDTTQNGKNGQNGGNAIAIYFNTTIQNNGTIAGGGGGGGGGGLIVSTQNVANGADDIIVTTVLYGGGGGGGKTVPGIVSVGGATNVAGQPNGGNGSSASPGAGALYGGSGGHWGTAGASGTKSSATPSGGYRPCIVGTGGAGGKAVALNGNTVTWQATGSRLGIIS